MEARGGEVVGVHRWIRPRYDSDCVMAIVSGAKRRRATHLLAETSDRLIRHQSFHSVERPNLRATAGRLKDLVDATDGLQLMPHLDPDASPADVHSYQRKSGQWAQGNKGGGSKRKNYRSRYVGLPKSQLLKFRKSWAIATLNNRFVDFLRRCVHNSFVGLIYHVHLCWLHHENI